MRCKSCGRQAPRRSQRSIPPNQLRLPFLEVGPIALMTPDARNRLAQIRADYGVTLAEISAILGMPETLLRRLEEDDGILDDALVLAIERRMKEAVNG
jgi:hypothetical protein